jgi:hypothetical protein
VCRAEKNFADFGHFLKFWAHPLPQGAKNLSLVTQHLPKGVRHLP